MAIDGMFPVWEDGTCCGCGVTAAQLAKDPDYDPEEPVYRLVCPECYYEGCHECMPLGRGSRCASCVDPLTGE